MNVDQKKCHDNIIKFVKLGDDFNFSQSSYKFDDLKLLGDPKFNYLKIKYPFYTVLGGGGTGKTYTIARVIKSLIKRNYSIICMAPTHKAVGILAASLKNSGVTNNIECITIHKFLNYRPTYNTNGDQVEKFIYSKNKYSKMNRLVLFIDECSMLNKTLLYWIERFISSHSSSISIIYIGDRLQLPPMEQIKIELDKEKLCTNNESILFKQINESFLSILTIQERASNGSPLSDLYQMCRNEFEINNSFGCNNIVKYIKKSFDNVNSNIRYYNNEEEFKEKLKNLHLNDEGSDTLLISSRNETVTKYADFISEAVYNDDYIKGLSIICTKSFRYINNDCTPSYINSSSEHINKKCKSFFIRSSEEYTILEVSRETIYHSYVNADFEVTSCKIIKKGPSLYKKKELTINIVRKEHIEKYKEIWNDKKKEIKKMFMKIDKTTPQDSELDNLKKQIWEQYYEKRYSIMAPFCQFISSTVYKAQGSSIKNVLVDMYDITKIFYYGQLNNENKAAFRTYRELYTALTRSNLNLYILYY